MAIRVGSAVFEDHVSLEVLPKKWTDTFVVPIRYDMALPPWDYAEVVNTKPFYLTRAFKYAAGDTFELEIINSADPYGKIPLVKILIKGHIIWQGDHPIAAGAQKANFIADSAYEVTPLAKGFADVMNQVAGKGFSKWEVNSTQSIMKKAFAPFGLVEGQTFAEYDLIYIHDSMLFWGARNVDGRGFDTEENRPTNCRSH